ncbi:MAG: Gfo/Idh/MocA family oxidoreductase [Verrucomicrobiota bacterium]
MNRPKHPSSQSRRDFLKKSAALGAATFYPGYLSFGQTSPNELLNIAAIGIGSQGGKNIQSLMGTKLCRMAALCEIDLEGKHTQKSLTNHPDAKQYTDFRKMFDEMADQIDAVLVATPDHSHFCAAMLAMSLGKPVYVQKPLAHTFGQCQRLMDMAAKSGVVTQMGNQGHSGGNFFQFEEWTKAGIIKDVTRITAYMNSKRRWHGWDTSLIEYPTDPMPNGINWDQWIDSAPEHPFSKRLHPGNWRSWFDYGCGAFGDWGPHILDTCHRFLKLGLPEKITPLTIEGHNSFFFPQASTIQFDFPEREGMPACAVTWYDGQDNQPPEQEKYIDVPIDPSEVEPEAGSESESSEVRKSKPGKIIYSKEHIFKGGSHSDTLKILPEEKYMEMRKDLPRFGSIKGGHFMNFVQAVKGEAKPQSPFEISAPLTQVFNLGCIVQRLNEEIRFDRKTNSITNNSTAQALLDPPPREGWEEFYQL